MGSPVHSAVYQTEVATTDSDTDQRHMQMKHLTLTLKLFITLELYANYLGGWIHWHATCCVHLSLTMQDYSTLNSHWALWAWYMQYTYWLATVGSTWPNSTRPCPLASDTYVFPVSWEGVLLGIPRILCSHRLTTSMWVWDVSFACASGQLAFARYIGYMYQGKIRSNLVYRETYMYIHVSGNRECIPISFVPNSAERRRE